MEAVALLALLPILAIVAGLAWGAWKLVQGLGFLLGHLFRGIGLLLRHVFTFVRRTLVDVVQTVGALVTAIAILPLALVNLAIGRWAASKHYGRAIEDEFVSGLHGLYRVAIGNPLRLLGLGIMLEGIERRIPDLVDRAPRSQAWGKTKGKARGSTDFSGYDILGALPTGGSGAQLFVARPRAETFERFRGERRAIPAEVVIKSFGLEQGSTLPQIVRESRALEAASRLGLVYEHHLEGDRFYYVMPYVRGEELSTVVSRLHGRCGAEGLGRHETALVVGYAADLLHNLERFHAGGLWHKDVKPANLIVTGERACLVDFGLVTPLASAMTLTTHGTEYYRDPEMVRLAMQGVKVHEVDGVKFDLYSAGAVLYSMIENSFPAHGSLSRITKRCPEALRWIVNRAMADIETRYASAEEMRADLNALAAASDPFAMQPAELPSFARKGRAPQSEPLRRVEPVAAPILPHLDHEGDGSTAVPAHRRRRRGRRVLGAAAVIAMFLIPTAVVSEHLFGRSVHVRRHGMDTPLDFATTRLYPAEREAVRMAREVLEHSTIDDRVRALADRWRLEIGARLPDAGRTALAAAREVRPSGTPAKASAGRLLLLENGMDSVATDSLRGLETALSEGGFEVVSDDRAEDERDLNLVALARHAVGFGTPDDPDAVARLQAFLDQEPSLEAVVWVTPCEDPGCDVYRVLVRRDLDLEPAGRFHGGSETVRTAHR